MERQSFLSREQALSPEIRRLSQEERDFIDAFFAAQEIVPEALIVPTKVTRVDHRIFDQNFDFVREQSEQEDNFVFDKHDFDRHGRKILVQQRTDLSELADGAVRIIVRPEVIIGTYLTSAEWRQRQIHYQQLERDAKQYNNENNPNLN
jgi:hypothetical protein